MSLHRPEPPTAESLREWHERARAEADEWDAPEVDTDVREYGAEDDHDPGGWMADREANRYEKDVLGL